MKTTLSLNNLINESALNNSKAQSMLMSIYWAEIKSYILTIVKKDEDAEDVTIETFTKVFNKLDLYNSDFNFKSWIISIAHNSAIDFLRKNKSRDNTILNDEVIEFFSPKEPSTEDILIHQQNEEKLLKSIALIDEKYRKVLELKYLEDYSIKEISDILDLSISNTKVRLLRARKLLENLL